MVYGTKPSQFEPKYIVAAFGVYSDEAMELSWKYISFMRDQIEIANGYFSRNETSLLHGIICDMKETSMAVGINAIIEYCIELEKLVIGKNAFIPDNDPVKNIWFHNTLEEMADYTGYKLANYYIMSADDQVPGGFPIGNQWRMNIKNSHLQYTIIWLSLGISLLAIYLISSRKTEG